MLRGAVFRYVMQGRNRIFFLIWERGSDIYTLVQKLYMFFQNSVYQGLYVNRAVQVLQELKEVYSQCFCLQTLLLKLYAKTLAFVCLFVCLLMCGSLQLVAKQLGAFMVHMGIYAVTCSTRALDYQLRNSKSESYTNWGTATMPRVLKEKLNVIRNQNVASK